jgi:hypothetical protein
MAGMTSPARPWFRLATRDKQLMESSAVAAWLAENTETMRVIFNVSNTYRALHSLYEELGAFGTGAAFIMPDFNDVIRHYPLTIGEYAIATNDKGEVDTIAREYQMTVSQVVRQFGLNNTSSAVKGLFNSGRGLDQWVTVTHLVEPRADRDPNLKDSKNMAFASCWFESGQNSDNQFLRESGHKRFPCIVPRWAALNGDAYGTTCPGMEALGDVKQLQHGQLRKGQALDYMVKPPVQVPTSAKAHEIDTLPGGVSYVDGLNGGMKNAFEVRPDINAQLEDIRDVRERIRQTFYADLFLMLANDERSGITAREVAERHEEKLLMLGPVLERLHNELLKQFIDITFDTMIENGLVTPPPQEMQGQELTVDFVSMLAQAQRAVATQNIDRFVGSLGMIAQFKPDVLDKFDSDQWADAYADMLGVDPKLIVANDKIAIVRQQRAEQMQQQMQQNQQLQAAQTAKTASQADTSGKNALTDVMQGLTGYTTGAPA